MNLVRVVLTLRAASAIVASTDCSDSSSWYSKKTEKDCAYVSEKSSRCKSKYVDIEGIVSAEACPVACGTCPTAAPTAAEGCADSSSWFYKKTKNGCASYVAAKSSRCKEKVADADGISSLEACPDSCGTCPSDECADVEADLAAAVVRAEDAEADLGAAETDLEAAETKNLKLNAKVEKLREELTAAEGYHTVVHEPPFDSTIGEGWSDDTCTTDSIVETLLFPDGKKETCYRFKGSL